MHEDLRFARALEWVAGLRKELGREHVLPSGLVRLLSEALKVVESFVSPEAGVSAETKLSGTTSTLGAEAAGAESVGAAEAAGRLAQAASSSASKVAEVGEIRIRGVCGRSGSG